MIIITKKIHDRLLKIGKMSGKERCGFLSGRGRTIERIFEITNVSKELRSFRMSLLEKVGVIAYIILRGFGFIVIYHTHDAGKDLSLNDLDFIIKHKKLFYLVVLKGKMFLYKILGDKNGFQVVSEKFRVR